MLWKVPLLNFKCILRQFTCIPGIYLVQNIMGHENRPMAHVLLFLHAEIKTSFEILMGHLEKNDGPEKP